MVSVSVVWLVESWHAVWVACLAVHWEENWVASKAVVKVFSMAVHWDVVSVDARVERLVVEMAASKVVARVFWLAVQWAELAVTMVNSSAAVYGLESMMEKASDDRLVFVLVVRKEATKAVVLADVTAVHWVERWVVVKVVVKVSWRVESLVVEMAALKVVVMAVALVVTMDLLASRGLKEWRRTNIGVYVSV